MSGVNVAVPRRPPEGKTSPLNVPLGTDKSAIVKPLTASENVNVTVVVSLILICGLLVVMATDGRIVSTS
ncbi:hypothetical protein D3C81_2155990 [compost metagenome]